MLWNVNQAVGKINTYTSQVDGTPDIELNELRGILPGINLCKVNNNG